MRYYIVAALLAASFLLCWAWWWLQPLHRGELPNQSDPIVLAEIKDHDSDEESAWHLPAPQSVEVVSPGENDKADVSQSESTINEVLKGIMDSDRGYLERLDLLQELELDQLSEQGFAAIREWLTVASPDTLKPSEDFAIRNDLLEKLMREPGYESFVQGILIDGVKDREQHTLWREYLLQHYSLWIDDAVAAQYRYQAEFSPLLEVLDSSLSEYKTEIAGTAILNYLRLDEKHSELVGDTDFQGKAAQIVVNSEANRSTRISAVQALDVHAPKISAEQLDLIIMNPEEHALLKLAIYHFSRRAVAGGNLEYRTVLESAENLNSPIFSRLLTYE